jgi:hypothetical protein
MVGRSSWSSIHQGFWKKQTYEKTPFHVKGKKKKKKLRQTWKQGSQFHWEMWNLVGVTKIYAHKHLHEGW